MHGLQNVHGLAGAVGQARVSGLPGRQNATSTGLTRWVWRGQCRGAAGALAKPADHICRHPPAAPATAAPALTTSFPTCGAFCPAPQDLLACLLLSEVVYKAAEGPHAAAVAALNALRLQVPPATVAPLTAVQFCRPAAGHAYMLARSGTALYACFRGTKQPRDYGADVNAAMRLLWQVPHASSSGSGIPGSSTSPAPAPAPAAAGPGLGQQQQPAVHRGFLGRAQGVPIEALYAHAGRQGLRLVLCGELAAAGAAAVWQGLSSTCCCMHLHSTAQHCDFPAVHFGSVGHSLGGAVAQLCTLRLLHTLHPAPSPPTVLRCIVFGSPAIGNAALADHVRRLGWGAHFRSIVLPGGCLPLPLPLPCLPTFC